MPKVIKKKGRKSRRVYTNVQSKSTCLTLYLPQDRVCSNCLPSYQALIGLSKKSSKKSPSFRNQNNRTRCLHMWDSKWANSTTEKVLSHNRARQYLNMPTIVSINYHKMYKKNNKANNSKQKASLDVSPPAIINTQAPPDQHAPLPFSEPSPEPFLQSPTTLQSILEILPTCCECANRL